MTGPKRVPRRRLYHENWRRGFIQNSAHGNEIAQRRDKNWLDNDGHLSTGADSWVNAHGAPEKTWGTKRFETRSWVELSKLHVRHEGRVYELRDARQALADAARRGQNIEWEIKDVRPWNRPEFLIPALQRFARHAEAAYGPAWRKHVNIKMVSTIGGGLDYVLPVLQAAHSPGLRIPTLLSVRGRDRFRTFAGVDYITYVRGSAVIR